MAAAVRGALALVQAEPERRERHARLVAFASRQIEARCDVRASGSHIVPIILGADERAVSAAKRLQAAGFDVRAVRPPTVPEGTARLRISLTLNVTETQASDMIDALADTLAEAKV